MATPSVGLAYAACRKLLHRAQTILACIALATVAAPAAEAVTTTTSLFTYRVGPGIGRPIPPPPTLIVDEGSSIALQAAIDFSVSPGQAAPAGSLTFREGSQVLGTSGLSRDMIPTPLCGGFCSVWQGSITLSLAVGTHVIVAEYGGDGLYQPSISATVTVIVQPLPPPPTSVATTTQLFTYRVGPGIARPIPPPPTLIVYEGSSIALQAAIDFSVSPGQADPAGSLTFREGSQVLGTSDLSRDMIPTPLCGGFCSVWQGSITLSPAVGTHTIVAEYGGDGLYQPSSSTTVTVIVQPLPPPPTSVATTTRLFTYRVGPGIARPIPPSPTLVVYDGWPIALQAAIEFGVSIGQRDPAGTLVFREGPNVLGTSALSLDMIPTPLCAGFCRVWQASIVLTLPIGTHMIVAEYAGDGLYQPSASAPVIVVVDVVPAPPSPPPPTTSPSVATVVEYFHAAFGHYFITGDETEIRALDQGRFDGWARTGATFNAYTTADGSAADVCRFFTAAFGRKVSHFYTSSGAECDGLRAHDRGWTYEGVAFAVRSADVATGACIAGTSPVWRLYNDGQGGAPNHRYTTDAAVRVSMMAKGWIPEGYGPHGVAFCVPD